MKKNETFRTATIKFFESKKHDFLYVAVEAGNKKDKYLPSKLKVYVDKVFGKSLKMGQPYVCRIKEYTNDNGYQDFSIVEVHGTYKKL